MSALLGLLAACGCASRPTATFRWELFQIATHIMPVEPASPDYSLQVSLLQKDGQQGADGARQAGEALLHVPPLRSNPAATAPTVLSTASKQGGPAFVPGPLPDGGAGVEVRFQVATTNGQLVALYQVKVVDILAARTNLSLGSVVLQSQVPPSSPKP